MSSITEKRNRFGMQLLESQIRDNDSYKIIAEGIWSRSIKFLEFPGTRTDAKKTGVSFVLRTLAFGNIFKHIN